MMLSGVLCDRSFHVRNFPLKREWKFLNILRFFDEARVWGSLRNPREFWRQVFQSDIKVDTGAPEFDFKKRFAWSDLTPRPGGNGPIAESFGMLLSFT